MSIRSNIPTVYLKLPPLPQDAIDGDRFYAFGWVLPDRDEWLSGFAYHVLGYHRPDVVVGWWGLRKKIGYKGLRLFPTPWEEGDVVEKYKTWSGEICDRPCKWMVAITYTASEFLFKRRPTPKTYKLLKKIFPGEPRWMPDYLERMDWYRHEINLFDD